MQLLHLIHCKKYDHLKDSPQILNSHNGHLTIFNNNKNKPPGFKHSIANLKGMNCLFYFMSYVFKGSLKNSSRFYSAYFNLHFGQKYNLTNIFIFIFLNQL